MTLKSNWGSFIKADLITSRSVDGMSETLTRILSKDKKELHDKGIRAKEFVLKEKNNIVQAEKIKKINKNWTVKSLLS